jgi:hypothetical protein
MCPKTARCENYFKIMSKFQRCRSDNFKKELVDAFWIKIKEDEEIISGKGVKVIFPYAVTCVRLDFQHLLSQIRSSKIGFSQRKMYNVASPKQNHALKEYQIIYKAKVHTNFVSYF